MVDEFLWLVPTVQLSVHIQDIPGKLGKLFDPGEVDGQDQWRVMPSEQRYLEGGIPPAWERETVFEAQGSSSE